MVDSHILLSLLKIKVLSNSWYCFFAMSVCAFNSLPKGEYSNLFSVVVFYGKSFSGKTSLPVLNFYLLLTFRYDKADILALSLSK